MGNCVAREKNRNLRLRLAEVGEGLGVSRQKYLAGLCK
jgi:hypothetical protein